MYNPNSSLFDQLVAAATHLANVSDGYILYVDGDRYEYENGAWNWDRQMYLDLRDIFVIYADVELV